MRSRRTDLTSTIVTIWICQVAIQAGIIIILIQPCASPSRPLRIRDAGQGASPWASIHRSALRVPLLFVGHIRPSGEPMTKGGVLAIIPLSATLDCDAPSLRVDLGAGGRGRSGRTLNLIHGDGGGRTGGIGLTVERSHAVADSRDVIW
jgi:hypothetical protein